MLKVLMVLTVLAQTSQQQAPPADGVISGRVLDGATGRPVAAAIVSVSRGAGRENPPGPLGGRIVTGADGRFVFRDLLLGSFTVTATKSGYADGASGRRRPGGATRPVVLSAAQKIAGLDLLVWKNGAIGGTVIDEAGEAVVGVRVAAFARTSTYGRPLFIPAAGANGFTDDRGTYRLSNLVAGDYLVVVLPPNLSVKTTVFEDAARTGRGSGELGLAMIGSTVNGMFVVGDAVMPFGRGSAMPPTSRGRPSVYPPTIHPSATTAAQASVISLASGEERTGIDVQLMPSPTSRVSGTLVAADGPANQVRIQLIPAGSDELPSEMLTPMTFTDSAGAFVFAAIPAGQYTLRALSGGDSRAGQLRWVEMPLTVGGSDLEGVTATLLPPLKVSARTQFDGNAARPPEPSGRFTNLFSLDAVDRPTGPVSIAGTVANGVVTMAGYLPGRYRVRVSNSPAGWMFKSAMLNGVDVSETPFDLTRDVTDLVLTFTDRWSGISGTVQGAGPSVDATVLVFTTDTQAWNGAGANPRRMKSALASATGAFGFGSLPPGDYYVTAIREADAADWREPTSLEALARDAALVSIVEGEHRTITVPLRQVRR